MSEFNYEEIGRLLGSTGSIIEKYKIISHETGGDFNIFEIADISTKEVVVCRVLAELLSPVGRHGQYGAYLDLFIQECLIGRLKRSFSRDEIDKATVSRESSTDENRRIDITIEVGDCFIPIEAKINAIDSASQCNDYFDYARQRYGNEAKIVFLTKDGRIPSEESAGGVKEDDIILLSFSRHILNWLEKCLMLPETIRKAPIREIIIQFISAIKRFTNQLEDKPMKEIKDLLSESERNMQNAYAIVDTLAACEKEMRKKFFDAFCEKFNQIEHPVEITQHKNYDEHEDKWPGVSYIVNHAVDDGLFLRFYLEADSYHSTLYAGFGFIKDGIPDYDNLDKMRILTKYFTGIEESDSKKWAIFQEDIFFENEGIYLLRTRSGDNNYFKLFDPDKFVEVIDKTVQQVNTMFSRIKLE